MNSAAAIIDSYLRPPSLYLLKHPLRSSLPTLLDGARRRSASLFLPLSVLPARMSTCFSSTLLKTSRKAFSFQLDLQRQQTTSSRIEPSPTARWSSRGRHLVLDFLTRRRGYCLVTARSPRPLRRGFVPRRSHSPLPRYREQRIERGGRLCFLVFSYSKEGSKEGNGKRKRVAT